MFDVFYQIWNKDSNDSHSIPDEYSKVVETTIDNMLLTQAGYSIPVSTLTELERLAAIANQRAKNKVLAESNQRDTTNQQGEGY